MAVLVGGTAPAAAAIGRDRVVCSIDRPCVDEPVLHDGKFGVHWHADQDWDRVTVRWSTTGGAETQAIVRQTSREGIFTLDQARPGLKYTFRLQGCSKGRCSPWEVQTVAPPVSGRCEDNFVLQVAAGGDRACVPPVLRADERTAEKQFTLPGADD